METRAFFCSYKYLWTTCEGRSSPDLMKSISALHQTMWKEHVEEVASSKTASFHAFYTEDKPKTSQNKRWLKRSRSHGLSSPPFCLSPSCLIYLCKTHCSPTKSRLCRALLPCPVPPPHLGWHGSRQQAKEGWYGKPSAKSLTDSFPFFGGSTKVILWCQQGPLSPALLRCLLL